MTSVWYAVIGVTSIYGLHAERFRLTGVLWVAILVPVGLAMVWVLDKKLLARSSRTRGALVAGGALAACWFFWLAAVLLGRLFDTPLSLVHSEGWKLLHALLCLAVCAGSVVGLTRRSVTAYCAS